MRNNITFTGIIKEIMPPKTGTNTKGNWTSVSFIVEEEGEQYPNSLVADCFNKPEIVKNLKVGALVTLKLDFRAREHNGRYFNSVSCYSVEQESLESREFEPIRNEPPVGATAPATATEFQPNQPSDDLPF